MTKKITEKLKKDLDKNIIIENIKNIEKFISKIKNIKFQLDSFSCSIFFTSNDINLLPLI